jgi:hypothetical protein
MSTESDDSNIGKDNQMASQNEEPVICSKCNVTFESDGKFLQHYGEAHKT